MSGFFDLIIYRSQTSLDFQHQKNEEHAVDFRGRNSPHQRIGWRISYLPVILPFVEGRSTISTIKPIGGTMSCVVRLTPAWVMTLIFMASFALAEVPQVINYQGRLTDGSGNPVTDGPYQVKFKIYGSESGNDSLWYSGFQPVDVENGLFEYQLGSAVPLPDDLFSADTVRWLGITVGTDAEITPRSRLISVPYAYQALRADTSDYCPSAVNLTGDQTITGSKTFASPYVQFYDSTMRINASGISIGSDMYGPSESYLVRLYRAYNTGSERRGIYDYIVNFGSGKCTGLFAKAAGLGPATGVLAEAPGMGTRIGVEARAWPSIYPSTTGTTYGVHGTAEDGATAVGIYGYAHGATTNWAGYFQGDINVTGNVVKAADQVKIDHPLDPENKYLVHSSIESPDMKNVYDGVVTLDANGEATVELPDYFDALNKDFRYQLTCIGGFAPVYVAEEITGNRFEIAGGEPGMKVSWLVTGIRKDAYAEANRIQVVVEKSAEKKGLYLHPEAYGFGPEESVDYELNRPALEKMRERGER
jgi:hypothetical protein